MEKKKDETPILLSYREEKKIKEIREKLLKQAKISGSKECELADTIRKDIIAILDYNREKGSYDFYVTTIDQLEKKNKKFRLKFYQSSIMNDEWIVKPNN